MFEDIEYDIESVVKEFNEIVKKEFKIQDYDIFERRDTFTLIEKGGQKIFLDVIYEGPVPVSYRFYHYTSHPETGEEYEETIAEGELE